MDGRHLVCLPLGVDALEIDHLVGSIDAVSLRERVRVVSAMYAGTGRDLDALTSWLQLGCS
jgi:hypothetical protein